MWHISGVYKKKILTQNFFQTQNFFWPKMNFDENYLWRDKTNSRLSKLPSAKVLLKLEFDTEDQVLFIDLFDYQTHFIYISNDLAYLKLCLNFSNIDSLSMGWFISISWSYVSLNLWTKCSQWVNHQNSFWFTEIEWSETDFYFKYWYSLWTLDFPMEVLNQYAFTNSDTWYQY